MIYKSLKEICEMAAEGGIRKYLNEKKIQKKAREELELRKEAK